MSYFVNPVEEDRCVFLTFEGEIPLIEAKAAQQEVQALLQAKQWHRYLVDVTAVQSAPKAGELFEFGRGLSSQTPRSTRIALVVRQDQERHAGFIEKVARNGGAFMTFFVEVEKAEAWLGEVQENRAVVRISKDHGTQRRSQPPR